MSTCGDSSTIIIGHALDSLRGMPSASVQCCVTSPPYWGLRDYGTAPSLWPEVEYRPMAGLAPIIVPEMSANLGNETTPEAFIAHLVLVFREVRRVLADDGVLWLNLGDSFNSGASGGLGGSGLQGGQGNQIERRRTVFQRAEGLKHKDLIGIPWRAAFALQADGWYLRMDNIWHKPNPMPESVTDRPTKAHEYVFLIAKNARYFYDVDAVRQRALSQKSGNKIRKFRGDHGGVEGSRSHQGFGVPWENDGARRNRRSVWTIATKPYRGAHFATFPPALVEPCILAGSRPGDLVLDPFAGSGTTGVVSVQHGRGFVGCELNPEYVELARARIAESLQDKTKRPKKVRRPKSIAPAPAPAEPERPRAPQLALFPEAA